jgi:dihydropyrimidinase
MTLLIKNGTVVSPTGQTRADVLIDGERIAALLQPGSSVLGDVEGSAERVIDAAGKYVVPGGVDVHTHMQLPFGGTAASDTFETGTTAAAWGGTTTIVDFAVQKQGERVQDGLDAWHGKAQGNCAIDYAFHMIVGGVDDDSLKAMDSLVDEGITSFKLFMAYPGVFYADDGQILRAMQQAANNGAMIMMHAENGIAIDVLIAQALARGETDPIHHGLTRPPSWRARRPTGRSCSRRSPTARSTSSTCRRPRRCTPSRQPATQEPTSSPRRVRSTSTSTSRTTSARRVRGSGYVCSTPLRSKHKSHAKDLWQGCAPTTCRSSPPTTARSA